MARTARSRRCLSSSAFSGEPTPRQINATVILTPLRRLSAGPSAYFQFPKPNFVGSASL
jgi:hypothetical protein